MTSEDRKNILLVEDEVIIAMAEKKQLEQYGYIVLHVMTGEKAIQTISENAKPIDLILMDIDLGSGIDGTEAAEKILKLKDIPVVFLSSHTEPKVVEKTEIVTSYGYVVKNSGIVVLDASIKMALKLFDARQKIKENEESLSITLQSIGDAVIATDINGIITRMNRIAEQLTGWSFAEAQYLPLSDVFNIIHAHTRKTVSNPVQKVLLSGEIVGLGNHTALISRDGTEYQIMDSAAPIKNAQGMVKGVILVFSDVTEHYKAEETLKESERMLLDSQSMTNTGTFVADIQATDIEQNSWWASPQLYVILGLDKTYPRTRESFKDLTHPEYRDKVESWFNQTLKEKKKFECEYKIVRLNDGAERWVLSTGYIEYSRTGKPYRFIGTIQDINDRKEIEEAFRLNEKRLSVVFNNNTDMQLLFSVEGDKVYRTVAVNQHYLEATKALGIEYSREYLVGKTVREMLIELGITGELLETTLNRYVKAATELTPVTFEEELELPGGHYYAEVRIIPILDSSGVCKFLLYTSHDITELKRIELDLRSAKELYLNLAITSQDLVWQCDAEGRYAYLNPAWETVFGYRIEEMLGKKFSDFQTPEMAKRDTEEFKRLLRRGVAKGFETVHIGKSGDDIHLVFNAKSISDDKGAIIGTRGTAYDITQRKRAEEEIKKQLYEKDILLREVHHRVKNNIAYIEGLLSLQASSTSNIEVKNALQDSISRVKSIHVLYDNLLFANYYHDVSIKSYAENLIDSIIAVFDLKSTITIEKHVSEFSIPSTQMTSIGIIINELLTNVFKYAFKDRDRGNVSISIDKRENTATIIVQDNGIGIDERIVGTNSPGFGLTIVKMLVEQLKGTYSMMNENGTKSVIQFEL